MLSFYWFWSFFLILYKSEIIKHFKVHRNWMAITYNLPISEWYYSDISEWTLDYPPFFAYFEKFLTYFAYFFNSSILILQKDAYFTTSTLIFQRYSVIIADIFYVCFLIEIFFFLMFFNFEKSYSPTSYSSLVLKIIFRIYISN